MRRTLLTVGEPAPWFTARSINNPRFHFDTIAGRYVVLCFFGSAAAVQPAHFGRFLGAARPL
jgi:peroxiredoxin